MTKEVSRWQQAREVKQQTAARLNRIMSMSNVHEQRALLAKLRRGVGRKPGDMPELWAILLDGLPESMQSKQIAEPSREEWAVYTALTVYALHQQGHEVKVEPMHHEGCSLGTAAKQLAERLPGDSQDNLERVARRFNLVATAASMEEMVHYLRAFVQLLRANGVALDYVMLADDLYRYQFDDLAPNVRLRWGEDYYAGSTENKEDENNA